MAPISTTTIPRLELCGARLLGNLLHTSLNALNILLENVFAWCDSSIVLSWLKSPPAKLKTYVANRVASTTSKIPPAHWRYVPTSSNPADIASRGASPREMIQCPLWWDGPAWLHESPSKWPVRTDLTKKKNLPEWKEKVLHIRPPDEDHTYRFSSYQRLLRVTAWCMRFIDNSRQRDEKERRKSVSLELQEVDLIENRLIYLSQQRHFGTEIKAVNKQNEVQCNSLIAALRPYVDELGLLRVGGRLERADLPFSTRHPLILHRKDRLSWLLVRHLHWSNQHAGPTTLMGILSNTYYIVGAKRLAKDVSKSCVVCRKASGRTMTQVMGQLPPARITPSLLFSTVGIDFAGPLLCKRGNLRKPTLIKTYICLFVCLTTKAVHLEPVTDLSTEAFMAAFRRFTARRGCPIEVFSDNGTNFTGAKRLLEEIYLCLQEKTATERLEGFFVNQRIDWTQSPGKAPHFGGLWEAAVKVMKTHLYKVVGHHRLTQEELLTILADIEATMNSRPLVPVDSSATDGVSVLTPGHFLIGRPLRALPEKKSTGAALTPLRRWNLCQRLSAEFWERWSKEYLQILQRISKWRRPQQNVRVGDIVLLKDQELFSRSWPMARVKEIHTGEDGHVRVVTLLTEKGTYRRPITRLVPLLTKENDLDLLPARECVQAPRNPSQRMKGQLPQECHPPRKTGVSDV